jgi:putative transcriptional regulator
MKTDMAAKRKEHKLTQTELGQICGVAQRTIAAYESGERRPSVEVAQRIAAELGFPWTDFFEENK